MATLHRNCRSPSVMTLGNKMGRARKCPHDTNMQQTTCFVIRRLECAVGIGRSPTRERCSLSAILYGIETQDFGQALVRCRNESSPVAAKSNVAVGGNAQQSAPAGRPSCKLQDNFLYLLLEIAQPMEMLLRQP